MFNLWVLFIDYGPDLLEYDIIEELKWGLIEGVEF